jgi:hypothetical protein
MVSVAAGVDPMDIKAETEAEAWPKSCQIRSLVGNGSRRLVTFSKTKLQVMWD